MAQAVGIGGSSVLLSAEAGCTKIISNKLRNLRKVIDKATQLEVARDSGKALNEDQLEAVKAKEVKLVLLKELEDILKRQNGVFEVEHERLREAEQKTAEQTDADEALVEEELNELKLTETVGEEAGAVEAGQEFAPETAKDSGVGPYEETGGPGESGAVGPGFDGAHADAVALNGLGTTQDSSIPPVSGNTVETVEHRREDIQKLLNLLHVADCINNESGSVHALVAYFERQRSLGRTTLVEAEQDLRAISYFAMMLTTPDGEIPIDEAVNVSTYHGERFINESVEEAFNNCTYATLAKMAEEISSSDLLRSRTAPQGSAETAKRYAERKMVGGNGEESDQMQGNPPLNFFAHPNTSDHAKQYEMEGPAVQHMNVGEMLDKSQMDHRRVEGIDVLHSQHQMMAPAHLQAMGMPYVGQHPTGSPIYGQPMPPGMASGYIIPGPMPSYYQAGPVGLMHSNGSPSGGQRRPANVRPGQGRGGTSGGSRKSGPNGNQRRTNGPGGVENGGRTRGPSRGTGRTASRGKDETSSPSDGQQEMKTSPDGVTPEGAANNL